MARKLGVGIVAYSPLGRGFLSRIFTKKEEINDWRQKMPRFSEENFEKNAKNVKNQRRVTPAQLELVWVHKRGLDVFPIQGNSKAAFINSTEQECQEIDSLVPDASGSRYDEERMKFTHSFGNI